VARALLPVLIADRNGISVSDSAMTAAVTDGHYFDNSHGDVVLFTRGDAGGPWTITVPVPHTVDGLAVTGLSIAVAAAYGRTMTTTFPRSVYNQPDGTVYLNYSATSGLLVAAIRIPREAAS
jgi:hypothetical protein